MPKGQPSVRTLAKEIPSSFRAGLEDVVAGESEICFIDGKKAKLLYRGYDAVELAEKCTFEEVAYLLWYGDLPSQSQHAEWLDRLAKERPLRPPIIDFIKGSPKTSPSMSVLRSAVSIMGLYDVQAEENTPAALIQKGIRLLSSVPTSLAMLARIRQGREPIEPRPGLGLAENFLYMLNGQVPDGISRRSLEAYFILLADHEFNASTFAARTTAATLSDLHSAVVSAIGALKGDLHGSANQRVMEMLVSIGDRKNVRPFVHKLLAQGKKIMGFGHRVYRVRDPRAAPLAELARKLGERKGNTTWFEISEELEKAAYEEKGLYANVDLYSASVLALCGVPMDMFTCMFACARLAGWVAHVVEQNANNRLIRPVSNYIGPKDRTFIPLAKRP